MPLLILLYPLLVHVAIIMDLAWLRFAAIAVLVLALMLPALRRRRLWAWLALAGLLAGAGGLSWWGGAMCFLYLPPVLMNLFMMGVFAASLRPGRTPLITAVASHIRGGDMPDEISAYTRRLTGFWAALFAAAAVWSAIAVLAPAEVWSWITNVFNYLVVLVVFLVEYGYRMWRYRHLPHPSLRGYLSGLMRSDLRKSS